MRKTDALHVLHTLAQRGVTVLDRGDLAKLFPEEQEKALEKSLQRLVADGILQRVCKGVYLNPLAHDADGYRLEQIASVLRRGDFSYLSLESMLAEYGLISQQPLRHLTVMTSGARGWIETAHGSIEFTHTKRPLPELIARSIAVSGRPLRIATRAAALQDLKRVGRNLHMLINQ